MTSRRKGEKPVVHEPLIWSDEGIIARRIRAGDGCLDAWIAQQTVYLEKLGRLSALPIERLRVLLRSHDVTEAEAAALAGALRTDTASLMTSIALARSLKGQGEAEESC